MAKILVIHGAGMNMRGKVQIDVFGKMMLPEYDEHIRRYAKELGCEVEIFHSNIEGEVINRLYAAYDAGIDGVIINPAGYTTGHPALAAAISHMSCPTVELHVSNPAKRGTVSDIGRATRCTMAGFGIYGYFLAIRGVLELGKKAG
jgi:3-dehydroquinate dehydratase-2